MTRFFTTLVTKPLNLVTKPLNLVTKLLNLVTKPLNLVTLSYSTDDWERASYTIGEFENPSNYQNGPDTYLLQVKDPDFPARLREYLSVARTTSAQFQDVKVIFSQ